MSSSRSIMRSPPAALLKHEPQGDKQATPISLCRKSRFPMRLAPTVIAAFCAFACAAGMADSQSVPDAAQLKSMEARFAPVDVRVDVSYLPAEERAALERLVEAS